MSGPSESADELDGASTSRNPGNKPREPYDAFFRGDFRRLFKYVNSLREGEPSAHSERDAFTDAMRWVVTSLVKNTIFQGLTMLLVIGAIWYRLYVRGVVFDANGNIDPNWVMALLTLAIVLMSILQWSVIKAQTGEFFRQNEIMIEQGIAIEKQAKLAEHQLTEARAASLQTDEIIKNMWLQQRPWMSVQEVQVVKLIDTKWVNCILKVVNSGNTPGRVLAETITPYVREPNCDQREVIAEFEGQGWQKWEAYIVPPRDHAIIYANKLMELDSATVEAVRSGHKQLHILSRYLWDDVHQTVRELYAWYTVVGAGPSTVLRGNYCNFD